jgi:hypothetical protein
MFRTTAFTLTVALIGAAGPAHAADLKLFGAIAGQVRNTAGVGQMGAVVQLYNRYERMVQKGLTSPDGRFRFDALAPDTYSVRVNLNSYVPAMKHSIPVRAGLESILNIQLANLFSSIELVYASPGQTGLLSEDWKWVLRSSTATRPVLRLTSIDAPWRTGQQSGRGQSPIFSTPSGVVRVTAGDTGSATTLGAEPDLGTSFAVATSLFGGSELRVAGNAGYASSAGVPTVGFRTSYSPNGEGLLSSPDVELTVRQASLRQWAGTGMLVGPGSAQTTPVLRTMSLRVSDKIEIMDDLSLQYGAMLEAVVFLEQLNLLSPYARLTYDLGEVGVVEAGYSSGAPAMELISGDGTMQGDLNTLAMFPRISLREGRARVQKNETYEMGYRVSSGSRTYAAAVYQDALRDPAVIISGGGFLPASDLLPDFASTSSVFGLNDYRAFGYSGSVSQRAFQSWTFTLAGGAAGMLTPAGDLEQMDPRGIRSRMRPERRPWGAARVNGLLPVSGTRVAASYVWTPGGSLGPTHAYLTQRWQPQLGLNVQVRQPVPGTGGLPGRLEMSAELRNLLADGYVPVASIDGRSLWLIQFPRTIRGGLSFVF